MQFLWWAAALQLATGSPTAPAAASVVSSSTEEEAVPADLAGAILASVGGGSDHAEQLEAHLSAALHLSSSSQRSLVADQVCAALEEAALGISKNHRLVLSIARFCGVDRLSSRTRLGAVQRALDDETDVGPRPVVPTVSMNSPIDRSEELMRLFRLIPEVTASGPIVWSRMVVEIDGMALGHAGTRLGELIALMTAEIAKPEHGFFSMSDDGRTIIPRTTGKLMVTAGRFAGIAIHRGIPLFLPVGSLSLTWFTQSPKVDDTIDLDTWTEWVREINPGLAATLYALRHDPAIRAEYLGSPFASNALRTLNATNVDEYTRDYLKLKFFGGRSELASRDFLRGLYEVLPHGSLKWFTLSELRMLFRGHLRSDLANGDHSVRGLDTALTVALLDQPARSLMASFPLRPAIPTILPARIEWLSTLPPVPEGGLAMNASRETRDLVRHTDRLMAVLVRTVLSVRALHSESIAFAIAILKALRPTSILLAVNPPAGSVVNFAHTLLQSAATMMSKLSHHEGFDQIAGGAPVSIPLLPLTDELTTRLSTIVSCDSRDDFVYRLAVIRDRVDGFNMSGPSGCPAIEARVEDFIADLSHSEQYSLLTSLSRICGIPMLSFRARSGLIPHLLAKPLFVPEGGRIRLTAPFGSTELLRESLASAQGPPWMWSGDIVVESAHSPARGEGVRIAWLESVFRSAADPANGLFTVSASGSALCPTSKANMGELGRLMGLAIARGLTPSLPLTSGCLYWFNAHLVSNTEEDIYSFDSGILEDWGREEDPEFVTNLLKVQEDPLVLESMMDDDFPTGFGNRTLSATNVHLYIKAKLWDRFVRPHSSNCRSLLAGIHFVVPRGTFEWYTIPELRAVIHGSSSIDREDLRRSATFWNSLSVGAPAIEWTWFWEIVSELDAEQLGSLLEFVSGSRKPPIGGFSGHSGQGTWLQVVFDSSRPIDECPKSQTCFKQLRISRYSSKAVMKARLITAITDGNSLTVL